MMTNDEQFESQFDSDQDKVREQVLAQINNLLNVWPDMLASYTGMVRQTMAEGWEELAARSLVLNALLSGEAMVIANVKTGDESAE